MHQKYQANKQETSQCESSHGPCIDHLHFFSLHYNISPCILALRITFRSIQSEIFDKSKVLLTFHNLEYGYVDKILDQRLSLTGSSLGVKSLTVLLL